MSTIVHGLTNVQRPHATRPDLDKYVSLLSSHPIGYWPLSFSICARKVENLEVSNSALARNDAGIKA